MSNFIKTGKKASFKKNYLWQIKKNKKNKKNKSLILHKNFKSLALIVFNVMRGQIHLRKYMKKWREIEGHYQ